MDREKRTLAEKLYNANVLTDASLKSTDLIDVVIENIKENGTQNSESDNTDSSDDTSNARNTNNPGTIEKEEQ